MPAKKKAGKGKKKKASDEPTAPPLRYVHVDLHNSTWQSMRLALTLTTDERIAKLATAIEDFHGASGDGLRLFLGESVDGGPLDLSVNPTLEELGISGGSRLFDRFRVRLTYDYPPFRSALNLPVRTSFID